MDIECTEFDDIHKIKVVMLGDRSVGKSSIVKRFIRDQFDEQQNPTVGMDFMSRQIVYRHRKYKLELWDTAGQQKYRSLVKNYLKDADCALFVYDVNDVRTYKHLADWVKLFRESTNRQAVCMIVGNKIDIKNSMSVPQQGKAANLDDLEHQCVSAKQGKNIQALFEKLLQNVLSTNFISTRGMISSTKLIGCGPKISRCCWK